MKKLLLLLLAAILVFSLVACTDPTGNPSETPEESESGNPNTELTFALGYVFDFNGTEIAVGTEAPAVITALGEPRNKITSNGCANFEGMTEIVYYYNSFQITTHAMQGKEIITSVYLEDDTVATKEAVCIGDDSSKVLSAYGVTDPSSTENNLIFVKGDMTISFIITEGAVSSILYSLTV